MEVFNLDIIPGKAMPVIHCSQFDKGRAYRANLFERGAVYILNGAETLSIIEKKSDGNMVTISVTNTSDSFIEFEITEQMSAIAGPQLCELRIEEGGNVIGSLNFALDCEASPDTGIESDSAIHNLEEQIGEAVADQYDAEAVVFDNAPTAGHGTGFAVTSEGVKNYVEGEIAALTIPEELDDLQDVELTSPTAGQILEYDDNDGKWKNVSNPASTTNFGAPYDENNTYNVPSLVIYNNLLYKLNEGEDGTTGPWDPTKWTQTSLAELTAEDFALSSTDPTPTSEAIGDLSQLTTSDTSSLVGAVNSLKNSLKQTKTLIIDRETISTGSTHTITNYSNYDALFFKINTDDNNGIVFTIPKIMYGEPMPFSLYSRNAGDFDTSSYYIRAHGNVKNGLVTVTYVKVTGWSASSAKLNVWGINFGIGT